MKDPTLKYIIRPMMSFAVVIKGPVARAGSISRFSSIRGTKAPNRAAKTITKSNEILTVVLSALSNPSIRVTAKIMVEHITPFSYPTPSSLVRRLIMLEVFILEVASP